MLGSEKIKIKRDKASNLIVDMTDCSSFEAAFEELKAAVEKSPSFWTGVSLVLRFGNVSFKKEWAVILKEFVSLHNLKIDAVQINSIPSLKILRSQGFVACSFQQAGQSKGIVSFLNHDINHEKNAVKTEKNDKQEEITRQAEKEKEEVSQENSEKIEETKENNKKEDLVDLLTNKHEEEREVREEKKKAAFRRNSLPAGSFEGKTVYINAEDGIALRSGQEVFYNGNLVILGDTNPGCQICATGSIIVYGKLCGNVHAGWNVVDETVLSNVFVKALKMGESLQVSIGGYSACSVPGQSKNEKQKVYPETAKVVDGQIWRFPDAR